MVVVSVNNSIPFSMLKVSSSKKDLFSLKYCAGLVV